MASSSTSIATNAPVQSRFLDHDMSCFGICDLSGALGGGGIPTATSCGGPSDGDGRLCVEVLS